MMGSAGEPERKRRQVGPLSPTAGKKQPSLPCSSSSSDRRLDVTVLQFQNQKLIQQLEVQKVECSILQSKFCQLKEKQKTCDDTLALVNKSWEGLLSDLESLSSSTSKITSCRHGSKSSPSSKDEVSTPIHSDFLSRLLLTDATESSSGDTTDMLVEDVVQSTKATMGQLLSNILSAINDVWCLNHELTASLLEALPDDAPCSQMKKTTTNLLIGVKKFRAAVGDLHLKHRMVLDDLQNNRDSDARNKINLRRLAEELANTTRELEDCNFKLMALKSQKDPTRRLQFPFPTLGNKHVGPDKVRDNVKELQELESTHKNLKELVSEQLLKITNLHEERLEILKKLASLKNTWLSVKCVSSSKAFQLLEHQLEISKSDMNQCQTLLEKLQVEKDSFTWLEKEVAARTDLADVSQRISAFYESRVPALQNEVQKLVEEKISLEAKLNEASKEPGRREIIAEFKALVSSLPNDMGILQSQLSENKEASTEIHLLRSEVQSLSSILHRKEAELGTLSGRSLSNQSQLKKLNAMVQDLRESEQELKLILEMYRRESTDSREVIEAKEREFEVWAHVQRLESSLDEHNLELHVKEAIESEAASQQRVAAAEAEIAELRHKLDVFRRDICKLTEVLKSKHEEGEVYLTEIESIGQAYEDMRSQNQQLLQQITQRDDHNIKLVMESLKARQLHDTLRFEIQTMENEIQQANSLVDAYDVKVATLEEQLKTWSELVAKFLEEGWQRSFALENTQRRLLDVQAEAQHLRQSLDAAQARVEESRVVVAELLIELEKERFSKKRIEEELEVLARKAANLRARSERTILLDKLQKEAKEYMGILKCSICEDRQKEAVITKCYHLFCSQCIQKTIESRHRKCPACSASFGPSDVKPIYI